MFKALADSLGEFVSRVFMEALARAPSGVIRPVIVGPPNEALDKLFTQLVPSGADEWRLFIGGVVHPVTVLNVDGKGGCNTGRVSCSCNWDYAVTVRNSRERVLILVHREEWDARPDSLANTTETFGQLHLTAREGNDPILRFLTDAAATHLSLTPKHVRDSIRIVREEADNLDGASRDDAVWRLIDGLLTAKPAGASLDPACAAVGVPPVMPSARGVQDSAALLQCFAAFVGERGFRQAVDQLKGTAAAAQLGVQAALDQLHLHLASRMVSPAAFRSAPATYYRPTGSTLPAWYGALTAQVWYQLLGELNQTGSRDRLAIRCTNAIPGLNPIAGGPFVVVDAADLAVTSRSTPVHVCSFTRKDHGAPVAIVPSHLDHLKASDPSPPPHQKPIKYLAESPNHKPGTVDVVALNTFSCGGLATIRGAEKVTLPSKAKKAANWVQALRLPRPGLMEVFVFHRSDTAQVTVSLPDGTKQMKPASAPGHGTSFSIEVDNADALAIELQDASGSSIGKWEVLVSVGARAELARSRLDALVRTHRNSHSFEAVAPDTLLTKLEFEAYLGSAHSWRPLLACWRQQQVALDDVDWNGAAVLGDSPPQINPRPTVTPPSDVIEARERIRLAIKAQDRSVCEFDLGEAAAVALIESYLEAFQRWQEMDAESAAWFDVFALHLAEWNSQAGDFIATEEPVVILLSPLHPFRLAWHAVAQRMLLDSISQPCPLAALVTPSACPDVVTLPIWNGHTLELRAFFATPTDNDHWAVLINVSYLGREEQLEHAYAVLSSLGLSVQSVTGGFTRPQTRDALAEVSRLLPARSVFRFALVGSPTTSEECASGVFEWLEANYGSDLALGPSDRADVYDARGATSPSPERLATLVETTGEMARWFRISPDAALPTLDLTILDQLGVRAVDVFQGQSSSVASPGRLFRIRIRQDSHEGRSIVESRAGSTALSGASLAERLSVVLAAVEGGARQLGATHFRFTPNQDAVGARLANATFLAITSSQIDPACVVRGTAGQHGFLWDYELPAALSGTGGSVAGYYLVAKPTEAMLSAVDAAIKLLSPTGVSVHSLLDEISRHGIPILKRLAAGGSESRGELGLLLAARLLQDAFRGPGRSVRLPVCKGTCIHLVLPVDPYEELLDRAREGLSIGITSWRRPDLIVAAIDLSTTPCSLRLTPVEVKFRAGGMSLTDMRNALVQAQNLGALMTRLLLDQTLSDLWRTCGSSVLAQLLDFGFRVYGNTSLHGMSGDEWAAAHERVLREVAEGGASLEISQAGRLLVFGGNGPTQSGDLDGDNTIDTLSVCEADARSLLEDTPTSLSTLDSLVEALGFSFSSCGTDPIAINTSLANASNSGPVGTEGSVGVPHGTSLHSPPQGASSAGDAVKPPGGAQANSAARTRIPAETRQRVRDAFAGFIGNEAAITRLSNDLLRALIEAPPHLSKNYLLTGLPSTGKTELARRIADALQLPFVKLDGRGVTSRDRLFELVNGELKGKQLEPESSGQQVGLPVLRYPPLIIFIDEVHLVPRGLQEALLTMLEAADRTVVLSSHVAEMHRATFLFATTRASDVDAAFASRCEEVQLREYTEDEVAQIVRAKLGRTDWDQPIYRQIARLGRSVPRVAIQLAQALETAIVVAEQDQAPEEHLEAVRLSREIDPNGLTRMDLQYLDILERAGAPVGEQNILNLMRTVDKDRVINEIEPFLVRKGFVKHGPRGRELTLAGREYVLGSRMGHREP